MKTLRLIGMALIAAYAANDAYSQESVDLIYKYYGYTDYPNKVNFIESNKTSSSEEEIQQLSDYYTQNEKEILYNVDLNLFSQYYEVLAVKVQKQKEQNKAMFGAILNAAAEGVAVYNQQQAIRKQEAAAKEEQLRAERQAAIAQNKQKHAENEAIKNRKASSTSSPIYSANTSSQGSYNDLLTSDAAWNTQVRMWVQQYGVEKTREMVKQRRTNDYQQSIRTNNNYSRGQSGAERIISAVTPSRQQIHVKVRNNMVVAFSNGLDKVGRQNWVPVVPNASISRTGAGSLYDSGNLSKEFSYTANVNGTQIYFSM